MQRLAAQPLQRWSRSSAAAMLRRSGCSSSFSQQATLHHCAAPIARSRTETLGAPSLWRGRTPFHSSALRRADAPPPSTPGSASAAPNSSAAPIATPVSASATGLSSTPAGSSSAGPMPSAARTHQSGGGGGHRAGAGGRARYKNKNSTMLQYLFGLSVLVLGGAWAAVPLYRAFCAHTGYGGTTMQDKDGSRLAALKPGRREVVISFNADVSPAMHWKFVPSQAQLKVRMGEPVLAFYKATNLRDKAVTGVATYNVTPQKIGAYFHKIQCFCFDEQRLRAKETVDMPVFFYIDPAMEADPRCEDITHLTLSYTFFPVDEDEDDARTEEEKDREGGLKLHGPGGMPLPEGTILGTTGKFVNANGTFTPVGAAGAQEQNK